MVKKKEVVHRISFTKHRFLMIGAFLYMVVFSIFFSQIGALLNWPFLLLPPFYALYISVCSVSKQSFNRLLIQRLPLLTIISFIGLYVPAISFTFIILFAFEQIMAIYHVIKHRRFTLAVAGIVFLLGPLTYFILDRFIAAGLLVWYDFAIAAVAAIIYYWMRRTEKFTRLFIAKD